ncbi:MAG: DUF58 domain-containing protein [Acidimicrobiia bacterium]
MTRRVAPTRVGWTLIGAAGGLFFGAWYLGSIELAVLAVCAITLVVASLVWSATRSLAITAQRAVLPAGASVGSDARAEITVTNSRGRTSPLYAVTDVFDDGRRAARFLLAPLPPGESGQGAYRLPTGRRGRFNLGPLAITTHEPFGLSTATGRALGVDSVLIRPRIHALTPLPARLRGFDLGHHVTTQFAVDADEFFSLREYVVGDDLRRVHWRSSARSGTLMVREDESRRRPAATVILDTSRDGCTADAFERAIEATASVCARFTQDGRDARLRAGTQQLDSLATSLDHLAVVEPNADARTFEDNLRYASTQRGIVAIVSAVSHGPALDLARATAARVGRGILVFVGDHNPPPSDATLLVVPARYGDFAATWHNTLSSWTVTDSPFAARSQR